MEEDNRASEWAHHIGGRPTRMDRIHEGCIARKRNELRSNFNAVGTPMP